MRRFYWNLDGKKYRSGKCLFVHRKQGLFLSVCVNDIKMGGRKQNMALMWTTLMKLVDLGEPPSFLDHVHLGCTQRECKVNENDIDQYRANVRITTFCYCFLKHYQDWEGHAKSVLKDIVSWQVKRQSSCTKFQSLAWMIITSRRKNWKRLENCQKYALKLS